MPELPKAFELRMQHQLGEEYPTFIESLNREAPATIRLHPLRTGIPWLAGGVGKQVPWCAEGVILPSRPSYTLDPLFHAGCYYVQEASSMFAGEAFRQLVSEAKPLRVLDCCAAPGGKSTHIAGMLHPDSLLVCNEVIRSRVPALTTNLDKWGYANTAVTSADPEVFSSLPGFFDVIILDAPCSGEGLFRKDHSAIMEWTPANANLCALRQKRILDAVWPSLKEGGLLIYSTCTFNPEEDEQNIHTFIEQNGGQCELLAVNPDWNISTVTFGTCTGYKFYPHLVDGEGFFLTAIRKTEATFAIGSGARPSKRDYYRDKVGFSSMLKAPERFTLREKADTVYADPTATLEDLQKLSSAVPVLRSGLALGTSRHGKIIPEHAVALSLELNTETFPSAELSPEEALRFLRKDTISLSGSGITCIRHHGYALGWANILPGRVNNLLPVNWRVRM
ncbi:MAG: methyltransferase RsmF C-terminal domain-like protein [Bacteroidota bacterium]